MNAGTNQLANAYYDLNGNMTSGAGATLTYDESNRLTSAAEVSGGIEYYSYSPDNKQVWRQLPNGNAEYTVYGAHGEKLGVFAMVYSTAYANYLLTPIRSNIYFAGKMIWSDNVAAYQDRLGTNRANGARFYPFGDEISSTSNDREKFATYTRDSYTGFDYADQRYYESAFGAGSSNAFYRFSTPDRKAGNGNDPGTLNRYAYVSGDPINRNDPRGLCAVAIAGITMGPGSSAQWDTEVSALGAVAAYPYQGQGLVASVASVAQQAVTANAATASALSAIQYALSTNSGQIDIVAYSGGAAAFTASYGELSAAQQLRIGLVQYISPGAATQLANIQGTTDVVQGTSWKDWAATGIGTTIPQGVPIQDTSCHHIGLNCLFKNSQLLPAIQSNGSCSSQGVSTRQAPLGAAGGGITNPSPGSLSNWGTQIGSFFNSYFGAVFGVDSTISFDPVQ